MDSMPASVPAEKPAEAPAKKGLVLTDLPIETQKDILSLCSQSDLICLSLVSRHFRELAAAQLYRNFHIVFPDEDDPAFDSPIDGLAGGLDTFVTSEYDYAKHLRDLSLDTLSTGEKAENAYKPYLFSVSCGKFMNSLLLLTLRKAKALESFRWNIRVELSRPVFRALHQIESLNHLHLRLQAGPSLYEKPPPLPFGPFHPPIDASIGQVQPGLHPPPPQAMLTTPSASSMYYVPAPTTHAHHGPKTLSKGRVSKKSSPSKDPPTLSGFKKLKTLSVLDIDSLDFVPELRACVRNSSGTLHKLKLSFSDSLGLQSRNPPPAIDPDDSDDDVEFQVVPLPGVGSGYVGDTSDSARAFRAQEERKSQEAVLGRIFDVESSVIKKPPRKSTAKKKEAKDEPDADPGRDFIEAMKEVSTKLMKRLHGEGDLTVVQQEILDTIANAATMYVAAATAKDSSKIEEEKPGESRSVSDGADTPVTKTEPPPTVEAAETGESSGLFEAKESKAKDSQVDDGPDGIDIEAPEEQLAADADFQEFPSKDAGTNDTQPPQSQDPTSISSSNPKTDEAAEVSFMDSAVEKAVAAVSAKKENLLSIAARVDNLRTQSKALEKEIKRLRNDDSQQAEEHCMVAEKELMNIGLQIRDIGREMAVVTNEVKDAVKLLPEDATPEKDDARVQRMSDYVRATRGIALRSLSIHLIPVKASVLSRALDIRMLHRLTLLNVGVQAPIWTLLYKENKESPLALRKIFTDNVSLPFLNCVAQLTEVTELFMLERSEKHKPESFAPKTNTTIEQIRRLVLKKHMPSLKRLMVKNQADTSWDLDPKAIMLICRRGKQLKELAFNMGIRNIHTFMQNISSLANLRALHIAQLRNDDTCVWVLRETKRFLVDNVSHHPQMKLEWICIHEDQFVERIIRPTDLPKKGQLSKKAKGKQKAVGNAAGPSGSPFPVMPHLENWDVPSDSDDEDDNEPPVLETAEGIHFYDVWGMRIFKKEVLAGRL